MSKALISKKTLNELQEYMVDAYVLRTIEQEFDAADIECDERFQPMVSGERRTLIQKYYHTLDLTDRNDVRKILTLAASVLQSLQERIETYPFVHPQYNEKAFTTLTKFLRKDGFIYSDGTISTAANAPGLEMLSATAEEIDAAYLKRQIDTMQSSVETHPGLAIGTAKELVETVCKTILDDRRIALSGKEDVLHLVKATCKELKLTREDIPDSAKATETIKRILSNLATLAQGVAELRNPYGTGHGRHAKTRGLQPRHARLAVGAAATLATFLYETHIEKDVG